MITLKMTGSGGYSCLEMNGNAKRFPVIIIGRLEGGLVYVQPSQFIEAGFKGLEFTQTCTDVIFIFNTDCILIHADKAPEPLALYNAFSH